MKILALLLLLTYLIPSFIFGETVRIESRSITLEDTEPGFDLTAPGKWFVQFAQDDWEKSGKTLYPDKSDLTRAVVDAQALFKAELKVYVIAALESGSYTVQGRGAGLVLSAPIDFTYIAACFVDGEFCEIYTWQNNKQYILNLYPDLNDESSEATTARANIVTQLAIIDSAADTGGFYK